MHLLQRNLPKFHPRGITRSMREGVTKFQAEHTSAQLSPQHTQNAAQLLAWRELMVRLRGLGQVRSRYGGLGFGNVSTRTGPYPGRRGQRPFLITATQTGGTQCMGLGDLCRVTRYHIGQNSVISHGQQRPSSESLTHGAIYDLGPHIRWVLHAHAPEIWRQRRALKLPTTGADIEYGTQGMAQEIARLARQTTLHEVRILAMAGHEDGVITFGRTAMEAGSALLTAYARAFELEFLAHGHVCTPDD